MKNAIPLALAAILSTGFLSGCTSAETSGSVTPAGRANSGVVVIYINEQIYDDDDTQSAPNIYRNPSPQTIAAAQGEIASNASLRAVLQGKSVQLRNVVGVQTALNGGKVVYVR